MIKILKLKILFSKWIGKVPFLPVYLIFIIDLLFLLFCLLNSFIFLKSVDPSYLSTEKGILWASLMLASFVIFMRWKRTYKGFVRFTDIYEIINIGLVFTLSLISFFIIDLFDSLIDLRLNIPMSFIFLTHIGSFLIFIFYRLTIKEVFLKIQHISKKSKNIVIFGAGQSGRIMYQVLKKQSNFNFYISGFFDDDKSKVGKFLFGIKIFSGDISLEKVFKEKSIGELIVATNRLTNRRKKELFDLCYQYNVEVKILPALKSFESDKLELKDLRNINLEELLGRDTIELDQNHLSRFFEGKVILVTGAGGSIGSELCRQIAKHPISKLILLDIAESALYDINQELKRMNLSFYIEPVLADIRNRRLIEQIFLKYKPNFVFHAAAYKHVPLMESFPKLAIETNIIGTKNLADAAEEAGVEKFVLISTDKAVNPTNVMGASKRMAELYIQSRFYCSNSSGTTQFITTRFGNVLGSNGSVIPLFLNQIEAGGPVTVTHKDIERFFMTIPEACKLVMEAGSMGQGGEIYVFDMGEPVKILDLAEKMIVLSGKVPNRDIIIEISGLRSGEKLYEELIGINEIFKPTHHPKIHIVQSFPSSFEEISLVVDELKIGIIDDCKEDDLILKIKHIIPEFLSSYSRFNLLDN
jgi:FlaA1/EpsC-like NDP-sugar epimerase